MSLRLMIIASLAAMGVAVSTSQAQVMQLGRLSIKNPVKQASCECSTGGGFFGKFRSQGNCESCCEGGSCGMAGDILSSDAYCEPDCGTGGLGYAGGFGYCGTGDCGSCGVGGYFGRNLHPVNPCACGGSLLGDLARGAICLVDKTVGCVVGGICGGLRVMTCHASGSLAALECAAQASCHACDGSGCDSCCDEGVVYGDVYGQPTPAEVPMQLTPAEPEAAGSTDPFMDDPPAPTPQAGRARYPGVQRAAFVQNQSTGSRGATKHRYTNARGRKLMLRR